jgi:hypothetical protein
MSFIAVTVICLRCISNCARTPTVSDSDLDSQYDSKYPNLLPLHNADCSSITTTRIDPEVLTLRRPQ